MKVTPFLWNEKWYQNSICQCRKPISIRITVQTRHPYAFSNNPIFFLLWHLPQHKISINSNDFHYYRSMSSRFHHANNVFFVNWFPLTAMIFITIIPCHPVFMSQTMYFSSQKTEAIKIQRTTHLSQVMKWKSHPLSEMKNDIKIQ